MIYVKFWDKVHAMPAGEASTRLPQIKHEEDLHVINSFNKLYQDFLVSTEAEKTMKNKGHRSPNEEDRKKDSDSSQDEAADDIEAMSKYLDKLSKVNHVTLKTNKKLNPYSHAQSEYKKSRTISKRLNTLSIFVKKDIDNNKYQEAIFDDDDVESGKHGSKIRSRK